ncbi:CENP-N/CHL4 family protein [Aspergillus melleus]|uniref:CENP-N/CHL4 family protein n=1 Tax=Aspergillus melleus TaxID=138277 RepID=UPI001E8E1209|nr:chromosome loss- protein [Aspergillus melleus]KAH8428825.1 chromosome loss- protein [Aspergillus melleus]
MARPKSIRAPTTSSLPSDLRIPSATPSLVKSFGKLTRQALLDLVFYWLDDRNVQSFPPFLEKDDVNNGDEDELSPYPVERTIDDVRNAYQDLQVRRGGKREVIDRILEGDWRHGISLRQLAMIDLRYMDDHPSSLRWSALELYRIGADCNHSSDPSAEMTACIPRIHTSTFLSSLQQQISPLVKAHYHLARSNVLPLTFLRIFVTNSPYKHPRQAPEMLTDSSRVIYVAFPDSCPFIYTSIASSPSSKTSASSTGAIAADPRTLQRIVRDAVPVALSVPQKRYSLKATALTAKSLQALLALRGPGRSNRAAGAFSIFADAVIEGSPLDPRPSSTVSPEEYMGQGADRGKENQDQNEQNMDEETSGPQSSKRSRKLDSDPQIPKKRKLAIDSRFGTTGSLSSAPLDRFDVRLLDSPQVDGAAEEDDIAEQNQPTVSLTFAGSDVISGIRKLAELGIIDPERMPSWMTGEEAVSVAVVRGGNRVVQDDG